MGISPIKEIIERINALSKKQRTVGLEEWESAEQEALRQEYLSFIREQVIDSLSKSQISEEPIMNAPSE